MRMRKKLFVVLVLAALAAVPAGAQSTKKLSAEQVLDRYVEAVGGRKALEGHTSFVLKGTIDMVNAGIKGTTEIYAVAPNRLAAITELGGIGLIRQVYDGSHAWASDPFSGTRELSGVEAALIRRQAEFNSDLKWRNLWKSVELVDVPTPAGGRPAYVVKMTPKDGEGHPVTNFYDAETFLLVRSETVIETPQATTPSVTTLGDYRTVGGVKIPFKTEQELSNVLLRITFTEAAFDVKIDEAKFAKPN
jgi:hypothetical protein